MLDERFLMHSVLELAGERLGLGAGGQHTEVPGPVLRRYRDPKAAALTFAQAGGRP
jgi:hypothetical protein